MARALILYFSQCGHTKGLAERLADRLSKNDISCDVIDIVKDTVKLPLEHKLIFIGSPVYHGREPLVWKQFCEKLPDLKGKAGFIFSTYGMDSGKAEDKVMNNNLSLYLAEKGMKVLGSLGTVCEDTWAPLLKVGKSAGRPNEKDLQRFDRYTDDVVADLKAGKVERAIYDVTIRLKKGKLSNLKSSGLMRLAPKITVNQQSCTACGVCAASCPVNNIEINGKAVLEDHCIKCYQCERVCRFQGILVNWKKWDRLAGLMKKTGKI